MDPTSLPMIVSSSGRPQAAVSPLPSPSDFVDVDLSSPRSDVVDLVPPKLASLPPNNRLLGRQDDETAPQCSLAAKLDPTPDPLQPASTKPSVPGRMPKKMGSTNQAADGAFGLVTSFGSVAAAPISPAARMPNRDAPTEEPEHDPKHPGDTSGGRVPDLQPSASAGPLSDVSRFDDVTEAVVREAFLAFGRRKCCYSGAPGRQMRVQELQHFIAYRYCLETFTEHRSCEWVTEHYKGQASNSMWVRPEPQLWEVPVTAPRLFQDDVQKMVVPHTTSVQVCGTCNGLGRKMCVKCHGTGRAQCMWCNGSGRRMQMETCRQCFGNGTESCRMCQNINQQCVLCGGKGRILTYLQLTVKWENNLFDFVTAQNSDFPADLFLDVKGEKVFREEQAKVSPIMHFPEPAIVQASQNGTERHRTQFSASCRILRQRHWVEAFPLAKVECCWREKPLSYFVYGKENKVFVQNYPKTCCCVVM